MRSGPRYGRSSASSTAPTSRRRQLFRTYTRGDPVNASLHNVINGRMGFKDYLFAGVDSLNATIDQALSEDKREMSKEKD